MGFVVMFVAAWLAIFILYTMKKSLSVLENTFVVLVVFTLEVHYSWIVVEEWKLIEYTKDALPYTGLLLYRSIVFPLLLTIAINAIYSFRRTLPAIASIVGSLAVFLVINWILVLYEIKRYERWNIGYDAVAYLLLFAVSYGLLRLYRKAVYGREPA